MMVGTLEMWSLCRWMAAENSEIYPLPRVCNKSYSHWKSESTSELRISLSSYIQGNTRIVSKDVQKDVHLEKFVLWSHSPSVYLPAL